VFSYPILYLHHHYVKIDFFHFANDKLIFLTKSQENNFLLTSFKFQGINNFSKFVVLEMHSV